MKLQIILESSRKIFENGEWSKFGHSTSKLVNTESYIFLEEFGLKNFFWNFCVTV